MKQGEIWLCRLDPTVGSEIRKTRPCLIISPDALNRRLQTVVVAPLTSHGKPARFRVPITFQGVAGLIVIDQMRALDHARLLRQLGVVPNAVMTDTLAVLIALFQPERPT